MPLKPSETNYDTTGATDRSCVLYNSLVILGGRNRLPPSFAH